MEPTRSAFRKPTRQHPSRYMYPTALLLVALFCFLIRTAGLPASRYRLLLDNDSYRFFHQAQILNEGGTLLPRDASRWVPLGRDMTRQLLLWPRTLQASTRIVQALCPALPPIRVAVFSGPFVFSLLLLPYGLLVRRVWGRKVGLASALLLSVLPGIIYRSSAGFSDRDGFCLLLGISAYLAYIVSLDRPAGPLRLRWTALCGLFSLILSLTWEGCALLTAPLALHWLLRILREDPARPAASELWLWTLIQLLMLVPTATYREVSEPFALAALGLPLGASAIAGFVIAGRTLEPLRPWKIPVGWMAVSVFGCAGTMALRYPDIRETAHFFMENILSPLGENRLFRTIEELQKPTLLDWWSLFNISLIFIGGGALYCQWRISKAQDKKPWLAMSLLALVLLLGVRLFNLHPSGEEVVRSGLSFLTSLVALGFYYLLGNWNPRKPDRSSLSFELLGEEFFLLWLLIALIGARGAERYLFFFAPPGMALACKGWDFLPDWSRQRVMLARASLASATFCTGIVAVAIFWVISARSLEKTFRGSPQGGFAAALGWLRSHTEPGSVVLSWWPQGAYISQFAHRPTIVDEDIYLPYWIHRTARALTSPSSEAALSFMAAHHVRYLMISSKEISKLSVLSYIGSDEAGDRMSRILPLALKGCRPLNGNSLHAVFYPATGFDLLEDVVTPSGPALPIRLVSIEVIFENVGSVAQIRSARAHLSVNGKFLQKGFQSIVWNGKRLPNRSGGLPGTLVVQPFRLRPSFTSLEAIYVPVQAARSLVARLFLFNELSSQFEAVYDSGTGAPIADSDNAYDGDARTRIWRIHYPPGLTTDSADLERDFRPGSLKQSWRRGLPYKPISPIR